MFGPSCFPGVGADPGLEKGSALVTPQPRPRGARVEHLRSDIPAPEMRQRLERVEATLSPRGERLIESPGGEAGSRKTPRRPSLFRPLSLHPERIAPRRPIAGRPVAVRTPALYSDGTAGAVAGAGAASTGTQTTFLFSTHRFFVYHRFLRLASKGAASARSSRGRGKEWRSGLTLQARRGAVGSCSLAW